MPTTVAPTTGPTAGGRNHLLEPFLGLGELAIDAAEVVEHLASQLDTGGCHRPVGLDVREQQGRLSA